MQAGMPSGQSHDIFTNFVWPFESLPLPFFISEHEANPRQSRDHNFLVRAIEEYYNRFVEGVQFHRLLYQQRESVDEYSHVHQRTLDKGAPAW